MARNYRLLACITTAFLALAGTASAAASLVGGVSGSAETDHGSADLGADANGAMGDDGLPTLDGSLGGSASAQDHNVAAFADADGNADAAVDDHAVSADVDAEGQTASVTVDGTTVSTDDLDANLPDVPGAADVPDPHGAVSITGGFSAMVDAMGSLVASLTAGFTGLFSW